MPRSVPTAQLLTDVVELREALRKTREPSVRESVRNVERSLRGLLGPSVPKTPAAGALGVSVQALDRWIDRGVVTVVARRGSARAEVETGPLLDLLEQAREIRAQGVRRGVLASAVERLGWRDDPAGRQILSEDVAKLPRPNVPARELREEFKRTTPEERVSAAARLSTVLATLAADSRGKM